MTEQTGTVSSERIHTGRVVTLNVEQAQEQGALVGLFDVPLDVQVLGEGDAPRPQRAPHAQGAVVPVRLRAEAQGRPGGPRGMAPAQARD